MIRLVLYWEGSKREPTSACDQFCESSFSKRTHDTSGKEESWFCRGLCLKPEPISACDQFCENSFSKRTHDTSGKKGSWFCRGLWGHTPNKKEGGCVYWKRNENPNVEDCEQECTSADFEGKGIFSDGTEVSETDMCKAGCNFKGIDIFKLNRLQTLEYLATL